MLWHTAGIETRDGGQLSLFGDLKHESSARNMARRLAVAFGMPDGATPIDARPITVLRENPADRRVGLLWTGRTVAALVAGFLWDLTPRT